MATEIYTTKVYITNCITRIMRSECSTKNLHQRDSDLAQAITIAAEEGETAAHTYLIQLCNEAERGKYKA